jgi:hypothetical protein
MGLFSWFEYAGTRGAILRKGNEQARRSDSTCDFVAREFVKRNGLNTIPPPVWSACLSKGTSPAGLTEAVRDILRAHCVRDVKEYAPAMVACALHQIGDTFRSAVGISLVKLVSPSLEKDADISVGAAAVLAFLIHLEPSANAARSLRENLEELTRWFLSSDHDYIWMKVADAAQALNIER